MGFKYCAALLTAQLLMVVFVEGQSEWVWGKNSAGGNRPSKENSGSGGGGGFQNGNTASNLVPVNTVSIFGSGSGVYSPSGSSSASGDKFFTSQSNIPISPQQPAVIVQVVQPGSSDSKNDILPSNSIRSGVNGINGEARLLPHVRKLFHNALHNLVGGGNSGGGGGLGGLGGLIPSGGGGSNSGFIGTLLQIGPQLAQGIGSRFPTVGPLPASSNEFNTEGSGGSNSNGISFSGQNCNCVSSDSCRLPSIDKGKCNGGIMCCRRSGTRLASDSNSDSTRKGTGLTRYQTSNVRAGLLSNIVRGTSNIFDDTLDLILAPFLNQEDQQRLANRIANVGRRGDV